MECEKQKFSVHWISDIELSIRHKMRRGVTKNQMWVRRSRELQIGKISFYKQRFRRTTTREDLRDSIESSFRNLRTSYIDSIILHTADSGWKEAYRVLEEYVAESRVHRRVSNFDDNTLLELIEFANVRPSVVQNWNDVLHQDTS